MKVKGLSPSGDGQVLKYVQEKEWAEGQEGRKRGDVGLHIMIINNPSASNQS